MASRSASMKRLVNALGKLSWGTTACAVFVVCAATAITLPAQVTTLFTFDGTHRSEERRVGKEWRSRWSPYHHQQTRQQAGGDARSVADVRPHDARTAQTKRH